MNASPTESAEERVEEAFHALRRGLLRSAGFAIYVCTSRSLVLRDTLIERLAATLPVSVVDIGDGDVREGLLDAIVRRVPDGDGPIVLVGFERRLGQSGQATHLLDSLNLQREEWLARLRRPIVFWIASRLLGRLTAGAPDFFDWRSDTLEFPETAVSTAAFGERLRGPGRHAGNGVEARPGKASREQRRRELEARIDATGDSNERKVRSNVARWSRELGEMALARGEVDQSFEWYESARAIDEFLGNRRALADTYGHLGNLHAIRDELDQAVGMYEKSLAISEMLGDMTGMADAFGNLGNVFRIRGELDRAIHLHEKALAIDVASGRRTGIANAYENLGVTHQVRGELDRAVAMHEKALAIHESLEPGVGLARVYGNLGNVHQTRGEFDQAVEMYEKALAILEALGDRPGMATACRQLGVVTRSRGALDEAEAWFRKALEIEETFPQFGHPPEP